MNPQSSQSTQGESARSQGPVEEGGGYWYGNPEEGASSIELLNLMRQYRETEKQMRGRLRELMRMGEADLTALRFLVREREAGRVFRQKDLASALRLTPASTRVLVDRLSRDGHLLRVPHPEDRRSVVLEIPDKTHRELRATLGGMHALMFEVTETLTEQERAGAAKFLRGLVRSVSTAGLSKD